MSLISRNEIKKLKSWAVLEKDNGLFYTNKSGEMETFWVTRKQENTYIMEYSFETLPEFEKLCNKVLKERMKESVQRIVSVATFKNMPQDGMEGKRQEELPEYRYTF